MNRRVPMSLSALVCGAVLAGQEPPAGTERSPAPAAEQQQQQQQPAVVPDAERQLAEQLLRRHAEQSRDVAVLVADYVQRRTTELSPRPLVSSGEFLFVAKPAAVVFRASKPRPSVVRLTADCYEVYRPNQRRLERFRLGGPQLAVGLFAAVAGDDEQLLRDFCIAGCADVPRREGEPERPARVAVRLLPRRDEVGRHLRELVITFARAEARLCAISYRDASGDLVAIELRDLRADPENPPSADLGLPDGVQVVEHAPPPPAPAGAEQSAPASKSEPGR
ncbi:MAG: outer membrane lipoprotein carrier protein LolA [Planctomycetes bacterium]|nr:outer membrane lipoprotein carrier protein LolA [Planctomycetota bacterium]